MTTIFALVYCMAAAGGDPCMVIAGPFSDPEACRIAQATYAPHPTPIQHFDCRSMMIPAWEKID